MSYVRQGVRLRILRMARKIENPIGFPDRPPDATCWHWKGAVSHNKYPIVRFLGAYAPVHRLLCEYLFGLPLPSNIRPMCGNPYCVNPKHMDTPHLWVAKQRWLQRETDGLLDQDPSDVVSYEEPTNPVEFYTGPAPDSSTVVDGFDLKYVMIPMRDLGITPDRFPTPELAHKQWLYADPWASIEMVRLAWPLYANWLAKNP